jgi:WD40 repeat protein
MTCLEKDRNRRYETAAGLAHDIERYLNDEPVQVCAPSAGYMLRKFVRRHKGAVLAASLVLCTLVIGMIGITWSMIQTTRAKADLVVEAKLKDDALTAAQQSERNANDHLFQSLINQARAMRLSGQVGQRFEGLKALTEARRIARARGITDDEMVKLRSEAIASLAAPDIRPERVLVYDIVETVPHNSGRWDPGRYWIAFDKLFHYFCFSDRKGNIRIRRVADGEETACLPGPDVAPEWVTLRFSPDGKWLQVLHRVSGRPQSVVLWELLAGKAGRQFSLEQWCDFSPDSRFVAGARSDGSVGVYEPASGREVKRIAEGMGVTGVVYHPDGRHVTVSLKSKPRVVASLDLGTGKEIGRYEQPQDQVANPVWSSDGRLQAYPCVDQRIYVWDHVQQRLQSVLEGHIALGIDVFFGHAGEFLISRSWDSSIRFWDPISGRQLLHAQESHLVAIRDDDRQVALLKDGHLSLWQVAGGWECRTLHHGRIGNRTERPRSWGPTQIDFSPDGRLLASSSTDGARLWDMDTFAEIGHLPADPTAYVLFHPDGNSLFTYGLGGLHRWPIRRQIERSPCRPVETEVLHIGPPLSLEVPGNWICAQLSRDGIGHRLAALDYPRARAFVFDLDDPGRNLILQCPNRGGCFLSPDGKWVVTIGGPGELEVWNTSAGKRLPGNPPARERFLCFTADSRCLVTTPPGQVHFQFWQIGTWRLDPASTNTQRLAGQSVSPDGTLFQWQDSGALPPKLISSQTEKTLATLEPPRDVGYMVGRFSPDGEKLVVGSGNHTMHVWDIREIRRELAELGLNQA